MSGPINIYEIPKDTDKTDINTLINNFAEEIRASTTSENDIVYNAKIFFDTNDLTIDECTVSYKNNCVIFKAKEKQTVIPLDSIWYFELSEITDANIVPIANFKEQR